MSNTTPLRLVALDLDGTLLNHQAQVTSRTRQAIADAVAHGVIVLPATGRPLSNLPPVVAQLNGIRYAITSNGAAVWDLGADPMKAIYSRYCNAAEHETAEPVALISRPMPVELAREAFALYQEYPGAMSVFCDGRTYRDTVAMERFALRNARRVYALEGAEVVQGAPDNIEVTAKGVDKGEALLALADLLGIPREATVAVGDSENDRAMLEKAGVAAVMANGMPHIQALADLVSENDCDHDGVAELFERLNL